MKHLLRFKELNESTSAFSHERAGWGYAPFSLAKNYDPRVGYSKDDFCKDLILIYREMNSQKKKELMEEIFKHGGVSRISEIKNLSNSAVEKLMRGIEKFIESKSNKKMLILPDGYILCYERLKHKERDCDLYYSPYDNSIKISYTDAYPERDDIVMNPDDLDVKDLQIDQMEFNKIIDRCKSLVRKEEEFTL